MKKFFKSNVRTSDSVSSSVASDILTSSGMLPMNPESPGSNDSAGSSENFPENMPYDISLLVKAPVYIDVGGILYTSSLGTLIYYPESKLAKMFTGALPIAVDRSRHFFIDRDGRMFRHILNFLRNQRLLLPTDFPYLDLLLSEAEFFELHEMVSSITLLKNQRQEDYLQPLEFSIVYEENYNNE